MHTNPTTRSSASFINPINAHQDVMFRKHECRADDMQQNIHKNNKRFKCVALNDKCIALLTDWFHLQYKHEQKQYSLSKITKA